VTLGTSVEGNLTVVTRETQSACIVVLDADPAGFVRREELLSCPRIVRVAVSTTKAPGRMRPAIEYNPALLPAAIYERCGAGCLTGMRDEAERQCEDGYREIPE
jgi:hypothetical protein